MYNEYMKEWGETTEEITEETTKEITAETTEETTEETTKEITAETTEETTEVCVVAVTRDIWGRIDCLNHTRQTVNMSQIVGTVVCEINRAKLRLRDRGSRIYYSPELDCIAVVSESINSAIQGIQPIWDYIEIEELAHRKEEHIYGTK